MSTCVLTAMSIAFPSITNRIQASVTVEGTTGIVASIIDTTSGHPARTWQFAGLPRQNYKFSLDEIDGSGNPINNLAAFDVVPSTISGELVRDDEQIQVGVTTGLTAGNTSFVFDGTGAKPNYIGFNIVVSEIDGRGILKTNVDYTWDKTTGTFQLLASGDIFQNSVFYNIHFDSQTGTGNSSIPSITDFQIELITANTTLTAADFGKKLIVEPASVFITVNLPDIATVVDGRLLSVEMSNGSICCAQFVSQMGQTINFLRGNIYLLPNESFAIYRLTRSVGVYEWRVCNIDGNFKYCGQSTSDDMITVFGKQLLDGSSKLATQYARIYNEIVLNLPSTQRVNYDDWATGNNKYLFSLANSANPTFAGQFKFPDRRGLFERNNKSGKAGDYSADTIKAHDHTTHGAGGFPFGAQLYFLSKSNQRYSQGNGADHMGGMLSTPDINVRTSTDGGTETMPVNYLINKYILI